MAVRSIDSAPRAQGTDGPPVSGRERKRLETRERIYEAAMLEFREVGFPAALVDRIVDRAGVARGTFYFHFATKEHVLLECVARQEVELIERLHAMGPPPQSVPEFLRRVLICMLTDQEGDEELSREVLAMYVRQPLDIRLSDQPLITEVLDYFIDAADRGAIRKDIPPEVLVIRFLGAVFHMMMGPSPRNIEDEEELEKIDVAIDIYFNGMKVQS
jgi:AcrR family transcriptional regulator